MNKHTALEIGDIVITKSGYTGKPTIGTVNYTNRTSVYINGKEFDRKRVERLNTEIRYHNDTWQHYHNSNRYWHPMKRPHREEDQVPPHVIEDFIINDWVIVKPHHGVNIYAGKVTEIYKHHAKINNNELLPLEYLTKINHNIRFTGYDYEHRHDELSNWYPISKSHSASDSSQPNILYKRLIDRGEQLYEVLKFENFLKAEDLPKKFLPACFDGDHHEPYVQLKGSAPESEYLWMGDRHPTLSIGDKIKYTKKISIENYIQLALDKLNEIIREQTIENSHHHGETLKIFNVKTND